MTVSLLTLASFNDRYGAEQIHLLGTGSTQSPPGRCPPHCSRWGMACRPAAVPASS